MPSVVPLGIHAVELAGPRRPMALWGLEHQVGMVLHETKGMAPPVVALDNVGEQSEECLPVRIPRRWRPGHSHGWSHDKRHQEIQSAEVDSWPGDSRDKLIIHDLTPLSPMLRGDRAMEETRMPYAFTPYVDLWVGVGRLWRR